MKQGDTVTMHDPGSAREHESWMRGVISAFYNARGRVLYIVTINGFKWDHEAPWGPYDGVPEVLARESGGLGSGELEWVDTWPRRRAA